MFAKQSPSKILVFVSSPGDCTELRIAVCDLINALNEHRQVKQQNLSFTPLIWEELPPGVAPDGKFQARINNLL